MQKAIHEIVKCSNWTSRGKVLKKFRASNCFIEKVFGNCLKFVTLLVCYEHVGGSVEGGFGCATLFSQTLNSYYMMVVFCKRQEMID